MRVRSSMLAALLLLATPALAEDAPADEAIIRELLVVTESAKLLDGVYTQVDGMLAQSIAEALKGQTVTPEQRALLDEMQQRVVAIFREGMGWEAFEPMMIDIYRKSFTRKEAQDMLDFYRTDAGRALIAKMPLVMEYTMVAVQEHMQVILPRIQEVQQDIVARLRALEQPAAPAT